MKHSIENIAPSRVKVIITVEGEEWAAAKDKAVAAIAKSIKIDGFRQGKAPISRVKIEINKNRAWLLEEAERFAVSDAVLGQAFAEEKLPVYGVISRGATKRDENLLEHVVFVVLYPMAKLGDYKTVKVEKVAPSVTEEEVNAEIARRLQDNALLQVSEEAAKMGDTVVMDFTGFLPDENGKLGEPFEGGSAENFSLELGSGQFIPGFEEAVVGLKAGEKKDIKVNFPEQYVENLAGKPAVFKVTVHEVKVKVVPELTDESVADLAIEGVNTVEEFKNKVTTDMLAGKANRADAEWYNKTIDEIVKISEVVIDEAIIGNEAAEQEKKLQENVEKQGLTMEQYFEITGQKPADIHAANMEQAKKNLSAFLVEREVARAAGLTVTDEEAIAAIAAQYGMEEGAVKSAIASNAEVLNSWKNHLLQVKTHDHLATL